MFEPHSFCLFESTVSIALVARLITGVPELDFSYNANAATRALPISAILISETTC